MRLRQSAKFPRNTTVSRYIIDFPLYAVEDHQCIVLWLCHQEKSAGKLKELSENFILHSRILFIMRGDFS